MRQSAVAELGGGSLPNHEVDHSHGQLRVVEGEIPDMGMHGWAGQAVGAQVKDQAVPELPVKWCLYSTLQSLLLASIRELVPQVRYIDRSRGLRTVLRVRRCQNSLFRQTLISSPSLSHWLLTAISTSILSSLNLERT